MGGEGFGVRPEVVGEVEGGLLEGFGVGVGVGVGVGGFLGFGGGAEEEVVRGEGADVEELGEEGFLVGVGVCAD